MSHVCKQRQKNIGLRQVVIMLSSLATQKHIPMKQKQTFIQISFKSRNAD